MHHSSLQLTHPPRQPSQPSRDPTKNHPIQLLSLGTKIINIMIMPQPFCITILFLVALQSSLAVPLVPRQSSSEDCKAHFIDP
jgi:hypothetical protein